MSYELRRLCFGVCRKVPETGDYAETEGVSTDVNRALQPLQRGVNRRKQGFATIAKGCQQM